MLATHVQDIHKVRLVLAPRQIVIAMATLATAAALHMSILLDTANSSEETGVTMMWVRVGRLCGLMREKTIASAHGKASGG